MAKAKETKSRPWINPGAFNSILIDNLEVPQQMNPYSVDL
jgi:hypothetical protein